MSHKSNKQKQERQQEQQRRLGIFVQDYDHYEEREVNGEWWVKQHNANTNQWQVAVYSPTSFRKYKNYTQEKENNSKEFLRAIA